MKYTFQIALLLVFLSLFSVSAFADEVDSIPEVTPTPAPTATASPTFDDFENDFKEVGKDTLNDFKDMLGGSVDTLPVQNEGFLELLANLFDFVPLEIWSIISFSLILTLVISVLRILVI